MKISGENHLGNDKITSSDHQDHFDRLPDHLLHLIFNKILDGKTLVRCLSVSKRFNSLIPQTDAVFLPLPPQRKKPTTLLKNLCRLLHNIVVNKPRNSHRKNVIYHSPNEVLKGFKELKSLHLELPSCKAESALTEKDSLLKWKAEFGSNLRRCVIIGANSLKREKIWENDNLGKENDNQNVLSDDELKQRIVWMISCLIAASARHYMLKRVVSEFPSLSNAVVSDGDKRGKVMIGGEEIAELRSNSVSGDGGGDSSSDVALGSPLGRSLIPDLGMKMWYVPRMVLPTCGWVMEGATLVVIRPLDHGATGKKLDGGDCNLLVGGGDGGFDGDEEERVILGEAVREMVKTKKTYVMEMTSF